MPLFVVSLLSWLAELLIDLLSTDRERVIFFYHELSCISRIICCDIKKYIILSLISLSHLNLPLIRFDRNDRSAAREEDVNGGVSPRKGYTR